MLVGALLQGWEEKADAVLYFEMLKKVYAMIPTTPLGLSNTLML